MATEINNEIEQLTWQDMRTIFYLIKTAYETENFEDFGEMYEEVLKRFREKKKREKTHPLQPLNN